MIKALIIDDERQARNALREEIRLLNKEIVIIGEAAYLQEAVHLIDNLKPELIFLDIQLSDGTGFHVMEQSTFKNFATIFITAYNEYAIKAFKVNALDYILKPVDFNELEKAVDKAIQQLNTKQAAKTNSNSLHHQQRLRISFQSTEGISIHYIDEIIHCKSLGNYTTLFFTDKSQITVTKTLKDVEDMLQGKGFERVHQSHLINMQHLKKYMNKNGGIVLLSDGSEVPVAQRKRAKFIELLTSLLIE